MRLYSTLISSILLASTVQAQTQPHKAGATLMGPENGTFDRIEARFMIPAVSASKYSAVSPFVAVDEADGSNCPVSLNVGIKLYTSWGGATGYQAWYQLSTSEVKHFDLTISEGHHISIAWTTSSTGSSLSVKNLDTKHQGKVYVNRTCGSSVTWGLGAVPLGDSFLGVSNFTQIAFYRASAYSLTETYGPEDDEDGVFNMVDSHGETQVVTVYGKQRLDFVFRRP